MIRSTDNNVYDYEESFETHNPTFPPFMLCISIDTGTIKVTNGIQPWNELPILGGIGSFIGNKPVQTGTPLVADIPMFCVNRDEWVFHKLGCIDDKVSWQNNTSTFPTYTLLVETDTNVLTGRFKIGDGKTPFNQIPWFGTPIAELNTLDENALIYSIVMGG